MRTFLAILAAFALQQCAFAGFESDVSSTNRVILKSEAWTPTRDQAQKALQSIQTFLNKPATTNEYRLREVKKILANSRNYRVQFVGMIRDGRKVIWCNFLPARAGGEDKFPNWKSQKVEVEDGGFYFWRIDYDPERDECLNFCPPAYG